MTHDNWEEYRTAFQVARAGSASAAAQALGVHHATVIRHVDALEERLGTRLFLRHARGFTPTEAGTDLLAFADGIDDQFARLNARIRGRADRVSGDLTVTTAPGLSNILVPALARFLGQHPDVRLTYLTDARRFRLELGEAHVAVRAGPKPQEPDNVAQPLVAFDVHLCASRDYVRRHGQPADDADFPAHAFVGPPPGDERPQYSAWLRRNVPPQCFVFQTRELGAQHEAIRNGVGIGFMPLTGTDPDVVQILPPRPEWAARLWLVTHMDLHRTARVQALLAWLKAEAANWNYPDPYAP